MFAIRAHIVGEVTVTDRSDPVVHGVEKMNMKPGNVVLLHFKYKQRNGLFISCPKCGSSSHTGKHKIENKNGILSADPSLVFNCCGWHGWLADGYFREHTVTQSKL